MVYEKIQIYKEDWQEIQTRAKAMIKDALINQHVNQSILDLAEQREKTSPKKPNKQKNLTETKDTAADHK